MPGRDRSGPTGRGAKTGRGLGLCTGYGLSGENNRAGRSFPGGVGRGGGARNRSRWFQVPFMRPFSRIGASRYSESGDEKQVLKQEVDALKSELKAAETRLAELDPPSGS